MEEALWETVIELLKIFAEMIGIGMLVGAVVVVSCDVFTESERHRLLTRTSRVIEHRIREHRNAEHGNAPKALPPRA